MHFWILSGSLENWERAISDNVWGVRDGLKPFWEKLQIDDVALFYVTRPISGIVGIGKIISKFEQRKPFWSDEVKENKVIYPYRFEFKIMYIVAKDAWTEKKISVRDLDISYRAGINTFINKDSLKTLLGRFNSLWNVNLPDETQMQITQGKVKSIKPMNLHEQIKQKLKEIGEIEGYLSETEYGITGYQFDVVWRSANVAGGVPKYVFEVQVGGDLKHALTNLKHAFDLWGFPKLFLIASDEDVRKAAQLLNGAFHEIKDNMHLVSIERISKLHDIQVEDSKLKKEIGI